MKAIVSPGRIAGNLRAPASKSYGQRALATALITPGITLLKNLGDSADEQAALRVIKSLGAIVKDIPAGLEITSGGIFPAAQEINCGESGLCARIFLPIAALSTQEIKVAGSGSLLHRPMRTILNLLPQLGVRVSTSREGKLPVKIQGPLQPEDINVDGRLSSQFISGLLFAFAAAARKEVVLQAKDLRSYGYALMSVEVLQSFGYSITHQGEGAFLIQPAEPENSHIYEVPGDYSSAAAFLLAATLHGEITIEGLQSNSLQPDAAFISVLNQAGAKIATAHNQIAVQQADVLAAFHFDATDAPDLFPMLAILASQCKGKSSIRGLHRLTHKESDRAASIGAMLTAFGVPYETENDTLLIEGPCRIKAASVISYNDHRIVMAAAVAALVANGPIEILDAAAIRKSYPSFFSDLRKLGAKISIVEEPATKADNN